MVALGVGIGVDYGIYIYSRLQNILAEGKSLPEAYHRTLTVIGNAVLFIGITLAIGVATWIFSPLEFQADRGILLPFMFLVTCWEPSCCCRRWPTSCCCGHARSASAVVVHRAHGHRAPLSSGG